MIELEKSPSFAFGPFVLNGPERLLLRSGEVVGLPPKVFETLFVLVENHGRVLTKNVLMETLWPDAFVEESSLTQNISLLRKALGNGQADQVYIETLPKRGYRFVAEVRELGPDAEQARSPLDASDSRAAEIAKDDTINSDPRHTLPVVRETQAVKSWFRWQTVAALVSITVIALGMFFWWRVSESRKTASLALKSVAVPPFKTVGVESEADLVGLGMADSVILKLNGNGQFSVLPTSSVSKYQSGERDALSIGRELGVDAVLDGTVQRSGDQVRVTAQLITLKDKKTIWSGTFDEQYRDIFCLQDSVAGLLAEDLRLQVLSLRAKSQPRPTTRDAEAYRAYLTGLDLWNKRTSETLPKAIEQLERAVEKDGNFALAHALLADCYYLSAGSRKTDPVAAAAASQKAEASALRAIGLDGSLAEAHTVIAGILANRGDGDGSARAYRRALTLNPNYATAHVRYAYFLFALLDLDGALREAKRARELDPNSHVANGALGYMLLMNREFEESIHYFNRSLELTPDATASRINLGLAQLHCGRYDEAIAEFSKVASEDPVSSLINLALANARLGRRDEAHKLIGEALRSSQGQSVSQYDLATVYAALGENERAFEVLRKSSLSWSERAKLKFDPDLDSVRSKAKFAAIVNRQTYPGPSSDSQSRKGS